MTEKYADVMKTIKEKAKEGEVCWMGFGGEITCSPIKEFIKQPADGILYDLNRDEATVGSFAPENMKWVNDFAVAKTIRALKDRIDELEKSITDVVRCGECKHWFFDHYCRKSGKSRDADFYCAYGERKEAEMAEDRKDCSV